AGLEQAVAFLERFRFTRRDLAALSSHGGFSGAFLSFLEGLRFSGAVDAVPDGSVVFEAEPLLRVVASLPAAQLVESRLTNVLQLQTVIASKAARCVVVAAGKVLVDFGLGRAHGFEAGLFGARAAYVAGFDGTSNVLAAACFGVPAYGTMAHSYV